MNKLMFTGPQISALKTIFNIDGLINRIKTLEEKLAKPQLEDLWRIEFVELEPGFKPESKYTTDAGHDLKIRPTELNVPAIEIISQYLLAYDFELALNALPPLYKNGVKYEWHDYFVEDRLTILTDLLELVTKEPVVCLTSKHYRFTDKDKTSDLVGCGFKVALPDLSVIPGWTSVMLATPRSGLGIKCKLHLSNTIGVIDQQYRDELKLSLDNDGTGVHIFTKGARVAQALIMPCMSLLGQDTQVVNTLDETERGEKGFGSSGV
jgi:deoxyuridine 5'-triphosphate nucleotidohydrolase